MGDSGSTLDAGMALMTVQSTLRLPPSLFARKLLCTAYVSAPFNQVDRLKFQGLHAMTTIRVISRHLQLGYRLMEVERGGNGYRIDLLFEAISTGRKRLDEVKSSKKIREVHRIQAALYAAFRFTEISMKLLYQTRRTMRSSTPISSRTFTDGLR